MTTVTYTIAAAPVSTTEIAASVLPVLRKVGHVIAVFFGAYASKDSNYRGLDLNGNPVWITPRTH